MKKEQKIHDKTAGKDLPPEVSQTVPEEITSSVEAMKEEHKKQQDILKQQWEEKNIKKQEKTKSKFKGFYQNISKGEGQNPTLKKNKNIGGVRGKFHPSRKGKT